MYRPNYEYSSDAAIREKTINFSVYRSYAHLVGIYLRTRICKMKFLPQLHHNLKSNFSRKLSDGYMYILDVYVPIVRVRVYQVQSTIAENYSFLDLLLRLYNANTLRAPTSIKRWLRRQVHYYYSYIPDCNYTRNIRVNIRSHIGNKLVRQSTFDRIGKWKCEKRICSQARGKSLNSRLSTVESRDATMNLYFLWLRTTQRRVGSTVAKNDGI